MKNTLEGMNNRLGDKEEHITNLEDRIMKITQIEEQKETHLKKHSLKLYVTTSSILTFTI